MTDFLQTLAFVLLAVNPAAAAAAPRPHDRRLPSVAVLSGLAVALLLVLLAALLADPILDALGVEPETFRVGAGVVLLIGGALAVWNGGAPHRGPWEGPGVALFPLALPVLATPAALAAAVSFGADRGEGETVAAAAIAVAIAAAAIWLGLGRYQAATDAVSRTFGAALIAVAAGLIVDGVRAI